MKAGRAKVFPVVAAVALAKLVERAGADGVIAEGTESGGHVGEAATMALVPQVCDAVSIPVVAAGGIADARQLLAAFALGAYLLVCSAAQACGTVSIADYNCPGQLVIGGDAAAVERACVLALQAGAKRCQLLRVSGAFHTPLMAPAGDALRERFRSLRFGPMAFPVLFNCTGDCLRPGQSIPALLERQVQSSVYLEDTIRRLEALGVDTVLEIGPGRVLSGFVKKTAPSIRTLAVGTADELEAAAAALKGASTCV